MMRKFSRLLPVGQRIKTSNNNENKWGIDGGRDEWRVIVSLQSRRSPAIKLPSLFKKWKLTKVCIYRSKKSNLRNMGKHHQIVANLGWRGLLMWVVCLACIEQCSSDTKGSTFLSEKAKWKSLFFRSMKKRIWRKAKRNTKEKICSWFTLPCGKMIRFIDKPSNRLSRIWLLSQSDGEIAQMKVDQTVSSPFEKPKVIIVIE